MNCQIKSVTATAKDGRVSQLEYIYLRGSKIRFMVRLNSLFKYLLFYYVTSELLSETRVLFCILEYF